jgi:opacity protein-like surface antigen
MQRSFTFALLLVVCFVVLAAPVLAQDAPTPEPVGLRPDAPEYALHGPYWVGTMQQSVETDSHPATPRSGIQR